MTEEEIPVSYDEDELIKTEEGGLVYNPYNPVNVKITFSEIQAILTKYNVPPIVRNIQIFHRAFVHSSYTKRPHHENVARNITILPQPPDCLPLCSKSNERLEFIGDGILEMVTKLYLYKRFPKANEGFMTEKKIAIVKNEAIGKIAYEMGWHRWLIISKHAEDKKIRTNLKKLGCLFEAFIGAVFLNFETHNPEAEDESEEESPGFKMAKRFIISIFETHIDWVKLIQTDDNYKNILQVRIQKEFKVTPHYLEMPCDAEFEFGYYKMGVYLCLGQDIHYLKHSDSISINTFSNYAAIHEYAEHHGSLLLYMGEGLHKIKRKAEQIACNMAITALDQFA